jgi:hypothetical protein
MASSSSENSMDSQESDEKETAGGEFQGYIAVKSSKIRNKSVKKFS